jgi:hypothetical protein
MTGRPRIADDEQLVSRLEAPSLYTSGQTLEFHGKTCHFLPLSGPPAHGQRANSWLVSCFSTSISDLWCVRHDLQPGQRHVKLEKCHLFGAMFTIPSTGQVRIPMSRRGGSPGGAKWIEKPGVVSRKGPVLWQSRCAGTDLDTRLTEGLRPRPRRQASGPTHGAVWRPAPNRDGGVWRPAPSRNREVVPPRSLGATVRADRSP